MKHKKGQRKHWTPEEDNAVIALVNQDVKWNAIAERLQADYGIAWRSGKQCRERWNNHLDPSLVKDPWDVDEQLALFKNHKRYGNTWAQIGQFLPGRSENAIKNQFYSSLRRQFKKWKACEPTRSQLKKYDATLTQQLIASLNRKVKAKTAKQEERTLADLEPVESGSDVTRDNDLFCELFVDLF